MDDFKIDPEQIKLYWKIVNSRNQNHKQQVFKANGKATLQLDVSDVEQLIKYCEENNLKGLTCLSVNPAKRCSTKTGSICSINGILIDIDIRKERKANGVSTEADKKIAFEVARKIIDKLEQVINLRISLFIDSGNGYHIYIPIYIDLSKFFIGKTEDENKTLWDASDYRKRLIYLENVLKEFNNDVCEIDCISKDIVRRVKIPGTWNVKDGINAENYRMCNILEAHEEVMADAFIDGNTKVFNAFEATEESRTPAITIDKFTPDDKKKIRHCFLYFINNKTFLRGRLKNALLQELCVKQYTDKEIHMIFKLQQGYKQSITQTYINGARRKGSFNPYKCDTLKKYFEEGKLPIEELCKKCPIEQSRILKKQIKEEEEEEAKGIQIEGDIPTKTNAEEEISEGAYINDNSFVGQYTEYQFSRTNSPRNYGTHLGIHGLGVAMGYNTVNNMQPQPMHHNTNLLLVGKSGKSKKSTAQLILKQVTSQDLCLPDDFSPEGFLQALSEQPHGVAFLGEFSAILSGIKNGGYMSRFKEVSNDLYSCPEVYYKKLADKKKCYVIHNAYFNVNSTCTEDAMIPNLNSEMIHGGFLARYVFVSGARPHRKREKLSEEVRKKEREFRAAFLRLTELFRRETVEFEFTQKAYDLLDQIELELEEEPHWNGVAPFIARIQDNIAKYADILTMSNILGGSSLASLSSLSSLASLASIAKDKKKTNKKKHKNALYGENTISLANNDNDDNDDNNDNNDNDEIIKKHKLVFSVDAYYIQKAWDLLRPCLEYTRKLVEYIDEEQPIAKAFDTIKKFAPITRAKLMQYTHLKSKAFDETIDTLEDRHQIFQVTVTNKVRGREYVNALFCHTEVTQEKCQGCILKCSIKDRIPFLELNYEKIISTEKEQAVMPSDLVPIAPDIRVIYEEPQTILKTEKQQEKPQHDRISEIRDYCMGKESVSITALNGNFKSSDVSHLIESGLLVKIPSDDGFENYKWSG